MIELSPLARPYAKAIFAAGLDKGNQELIAKDLILLSAVSQTTEVSSLIEDPELSKEQIAQTIIGLADDEIGGLSIKMLELLAENKRLNLIAAINTSYQELLEQHNNTSSIVVNVADQPSEDNKQTIVIVNFDSTSLGLKYIDDQQTIKIIIIGKITLYK